MYEQYNSFFPKRIYSGNKIREKLGEIPQDATRIPIPKFLGRLTGDYYIVNEVDKQELDGNSFGALWIKLGEAGRLARLRTELDGAFRPRF